MKNTFVISCPIDTYSGYGARSRDLVKAIIESDKYDVKILQQRWGGTSWGFIENHQEWHFLKPYLLPVGQKLTEQPDIWAQITIPNEFQPIGKYNIGITAGVETTVCAPTWIEGLNKMNLNLVSSNHAKQVFESAQFEIKDKDTQQHKGTLKLEKPIEVIFEGANLDIYKPTAEPCLINFDIPESFAYLFVGHWMQGDLGEDRKNVGLLVKAFYETFKNKKTKPALILKTSSAVTSYMDRDSILKKISQIKNTVNSTNLPNVYVLHGDFTDEEMNSLYNHSKVKAMVSLTKGEGFGRPLLEFTLSKKPLITTNWSGHIDFLNPEFTSLIGGTLTQVHPSAANDWILKEAQWFSPDHGQIGHFLKDTFENYKNYTDGAKRQAYRSKTEFSWDGMKKLLNTILENNIPEMSKLVSLNLPKLEKIDLSGL
jgi:glycosyltransferase involved in cell wall biosynthesis